VVAGERVDLASEPGQPQLAGQRVRFGDEE
jgi:hypothetical protein